MLLHLSCIVTACPQSSPTPAYTLLRGTYKMKHHHFCISGRLMKHRLSDSLIELRCWGDLVLGVRRPVAQDRAVDDLGVGAVFAVPAVATTYPRQLIGHRGEQVV